MRSNGVRPTGMRFVSASSPETPLPAGRSSPLARSSFQM
jgi:hypothetical protein